MTMAAAAGPSVPLVGKKMMGKLGAMPNEAAAAGVSAFARRQMEKMGWSDGKGLGKQEQGMVSHVKVKRREENAGVGVEKQGVEEQKNQWWYNVYDKLADKIRVDPSSDEEGDDDSKKKKKKSKKDKKRKRDEDADKDKKFRIPTDEELFAATGGKLFGRRAYGSCKGKLKRDELHVAGKLKEKSADGSSDDEKKRKKKKSKKERKAKKAKRESGSDVE